VAFPVFDYRVSLHNTEGIKLHTGNCKRYRDMNRKDIRIFVPHTMCKQRILNEDSEHRGCFYASNCK